METDKYASLINTLMKLIYYCSVWYSGTKQTVTMTRSINLKLLCKKVKKKAKSFATTFKWKLLEACKNPWILSPLTKEKNEATFATTRICHIAIIQSLSCQLTLGYPKVHIFTYTANFCEKNLNFHGKSHNFHGKTPNFPGFYTNIHGMY